MRRIPYQRIVESVKEMCIDAAHRLGEDVLEVLARAERSETDERAKDILRQIQQNAELAADEMYPLCQDTGVTVVFVEQGIGVLIDPPAGDAQAGLVDAINEGVAAGYEAGYLRKSIVFDPVDLRKNTGTNRPAIVHLSEVGGDRLKVSVILKGGGCENRSQFKMLTPAQGQAGVEDFIVQVARQAGADACPPFVVGVGIGGDFEFAAVISKRTLLRRLDSSHPDPYYADMERRLLSRINGLGIGPMGMGGQTTALAVLIDVHPCHIASLPVAVNIDCHSHRHRSREI